MDVWVGWLTSQGMNGYMQGWMGGWKGGWVHGRTDGKKERRIGKWENRCMRGRMGG